MADNSVATKQSVIGKICSRGRPLVIEEVVEQAKYISAILNSSLGRWFLLQENKIPIPHINIEEQAPYIRLVDRILGAKAVNPKADTREMEEKLDWLVYDLYGLTDEEAAVVAAYFWDGQLTEAEENTALLRAMEEADINDRVSLEEVREVLRAPDEC